MPVVTISAAYGAGGSAIGPAVAEQLGVPFLDRAIPVAVAERLDVSERDACDRDESIGPWFSRALLAFGQMGPVLGGAGTETPPVAGPDEFCDATEQVLRERAASGGAVILGRAGALVLAEHPTALHVRLHGPLAARIEQAMALGETDRAAAERLAQQTDRQRERYVQHFYRADARDPVHYHLVLDSTAMPLEACTALIVAAARGREG